MLPAFLITFREVIEATLIVATILGILVKLGYKKSIFTVWLATVAAVVVSIGLLLGSSLLGIKIQELYKDRTEGIIEGILMLVSAVFITWAVFWLHKYFARHKLALLQKVRQTVISKSKTNLFFLVFFAVVREGFEIVLFLSAIYLSGSPMSVLKGFSLGTIGALFVTGGLFYATVRLPVYKAFRLTTTLLILFSAGLAGRGVSEFIKAGVIPGYLKITFAFIPPKGHLVADIIKVILGWEQTMDFLQLVVYAGYITFLSWYLNKKTTVSQSEQSLN